MGSIALSTGIRLAAAGCAVIATLTACSGAADRTSETTVSTSGAPSGTSITPSPTQKAAVPSLSPSGPQSISPNGTGPRPATPMPGKVQDGGQ